PPPPAPPIVPTPVLPPVEKGRAHSPMLATLASIVPGAGQAYNGRPLKALLFFFFAPLILPWIWSFFDAYGEAKRMVREGGRYGRGGFGWIFIQGWLVFNATLLVF